MPEITFDDKRFKDVLAGQVGRSIPMYIPSAGVCLLHSAIRLLCLHPQYQEFTEEMKAYVMSVRRWCCEMLNEMGLDCDVIAYLDADEKEEDPGMPEKLLPVLHATQYLLYRIDVYPVILTIIHGALVVSLAHPDTQFTPESRKLVAEIRAACITMYQMFGLTEEEADFLDTH